MNPDLGYPMTRQHFVFRYLAVLLGLVVVFLLGACTPAGSTYEVGGHAMAGPVCPVERNPPDPSCAPRPVSGAVLIITTADGHEVGRATTTADGRWVLALPAGSYTLTPQPVTGLLGVARPVTFTVTAAGSSVSLDVTYDTGIR
jgi:hypothetical protein